MATDVQIFQQSQAERDFASALVLGLIEGTEPEVKFGYTASIGTFGDVWPPATVYVFPIMAGQAVEAVSTLAGDTHDLTIIGLDATTKLPRTETVTLTGVTPVSIQGLWSSITRAYNDDSTSFVGIINIRGTGSPNSNIFAQVLVEDQQTTQCPFMVPDDSVAVINNYSTAINKSGGADVSAIMRLVITRFGKVPRTQIRYGLQRSGVSNISSDLIIPILVAPLARIQVTADPTANADISAEYSMLLIKKNLVPAAVLQALIEG